jgi:hypothetical protein
LQLLYPTAPGANPPTITSLDDAGRAGLDLVDAGDDRHVIATRDSGRSGVSVVDEHLDGSLRLAFGDELSELQMAAPLVRTTQPACSGSGWARTGGCRRG